MLIFGGWLLAIWITIQIRHCVYLEYPYLKVRIVFLSIGVVALLCVRYAAKKRGGWGVLYVVPVIIGLWTLVVVPDIVPHGMQSQRHIRNMKSELESFSKQYGHFPDHETALPVEVSEDPSPYYQNGRQLPFRTVLVPNAAGPFLNNPGADPGVIFYAVSVDQQEVWLTGTELRFMRCGGRVQFIRFLSWDGDGRVLHLHAGQPPVPK